MMIPTKIKQKNLFFLIHQILSIIKTSSEEFRQKKSFLIINQYRKLMSKNKLFKMILILAKTQMNKA